MFVKCTSHRVIIYLFTNFSLGKCCLLLEDLGKSVEAEEFIIFTPDFTMLIQITLCLLSSSSHNIATWSFSATCSRVSSFLPLVWSPTASGPSNPLAQVLERIKNNLLAKTNQRVWSLRSQCLVQLMHHFQCIYCFIKLHNVSSIFVNTYIFIVFW